MKRTARFLTAALLVLPLVFSLGLNGAFAGSTQTGTIRGKIVDDKGQPLPGVTILLRSDALVRERATVTDADGNFFAAGLPSGKYTVVAQLAGFQTIAQDTTVQVDKTTQLPSTQLKEGELQETVTVTADKPIVDKTASEKAVVIEKSFTEKLPAGRTYQSLIQYAPGVTGGANPNILGGTANSNLYLIDGVSGNDPVTGTFGFNLNFDAIDAVDIKLTGISAEYGQLQGGLTNLTTKTGGNEWSGSLRDVVSAPNWRTTFTTRAQKYFSPDATLPAEPSRTGAGDDKDNRISATLGGPIVPDNAWFYLSYDRNNSITSSFLGNPSGGPSGDGTYGGFFDGNFSLGKLTWQATNDHRLGYQYSEDPALVTVCYGAQFFGGPCYDNWTVDRQKQGGFTWVANWNATWGPNVVSDVKVAKFKNTFLIVPNQPLPGVAPGIPLSGTGDISPAIDLNVTGTLFDANIFSSDPDARNRDQYEAAVTMFLEGAGTHTLKIGADYQKQDRLGSSIIQGNGLFYFGFADNNDDGTIDDPPPGLGGTGSATDPANRSYIQWYDYAPPGSGGPTNKYTALYINDDWQLNDYLSFNLGLRAEKSENLNDVGEKIIDDLGYAPRLGVNWDITGQGKHVLRASAARYLAGINLTTLSPFVRAAGGQSSYDVYYNLDYPHSPPPGGMPNWVFGYSVSPDPETSTFQDDLQPQLVDEGTVRYDWAVSPTFGLGGQLVYRRWDNIITSLNSYDYPNGTQPGRKIIQFINNDDAERDYKAVIVSAEKRLADNWMLMGNYTYSVAEGNVTSEGGFDTYGAFPGVPQSTENKQGKLPWDSTHNAKLQGYYQVPLRAGRHGLSFGAIFDYRSGFPYAANATTTQIVVGPGPNGIQDIPLGVRGVGATDDQADSVAVFFEERGSRRAPHNTRFDMSANYKFNFTRDVNFEAILEVFNVTNEQRPTTVSTSTNSITGVTGPTFGYPTAYSQLQAPRSFRFQFAVTW